MERGQLTNKTKSRHSLIEISYCVPLRAAVGRIALGWIVAHPNIKASLASTSHAENNLLERRNGLRRSIYLPA
jgi:hypothetical protein